MARRKKKGKSPVHLVMMKITSDSWDVKGKMVQVEVRAADERQARSEALAFARSVYGKDKEDEKQGYHIKAVSQMEEDGTLLSPSILTYKPDEVLTRGKLPTEKVHAPSVPKAKALTTSVKSVVQQKSRKVATPVARSRWALIDNPLSEEVVRRMARGKIVHEYEKGNVRKLTGSK